MGSDAGNEYDLNSITEEDVPKRRRRRKPEKSDDLCEQISDGDDPPSSFDSAQWILSAPDQFRPSGRSYAALTPGIYRAVADRGGVFAERQKVINDQLHILPDSCNESVIQNIRKFWASRGIYQKYGLSYKRGILFFGPPGGGKTAQIGQICQELIRIKGGVVFLCQNPNLLSLLLVQLRKIEPDRPLVIVMEDIDEIIDDHGEHDLLALLDGELQIDNCVFLASTNYPRKLGARIVNRPARFDDRVKVGMPSAITRKAYIEIVTATNPLTPQELRRWTKDTQGMSIAHIRELTVAVRCLDQEYDDVVARLKSMRTLPDEEPGIGGTIGLPKKEDYDEHDIQ